IAAEAPVEEIEPSAPETPIAEGPAPAAGAGGEVKSTGTKVIRLKTPSFPIPKPAQKSAPQKPAPQKPAPMAQQPGRPDTRPGRPHTRRGRTYTRPGRPDTRPGRPDGRPDVRMDARQAGPRPQDQEAPAGGKGVHLLPSGAQQRTVYIPPKDQRPKGRHQQRH